MKYKLMVTLEYNGPRYGHRPQVIKDWVFEKLHLPGLEQGTLEVVGIRELPPEEKVDFGKDTMI